MLISLRYLLDRLVHGRFRAAEVRDVRRRLVAAGAEIASEEERALALELRHLRGRLVSVLGSVESCARCASEKTGGWPGGDCCSGRTERLFTDHELRALWLSGTRPGHFLAPEGEHRGCAFRGSRGCALEPAHRPSICVSYTCRDLGRELCGRADRERLAELHEEHHRALERFAELRAARRDCSISTPPSR